MPNDDWIVPIQLSHNGFIYQIHMVSNDHGVLFSDGVKTSGLKHCAKAFEGFLLRLWEDVRTNNIYNFT